MAKRGSGITVHLTNRWLYTFIALIIIVIVSVGVYATSHPDPGHPASEISIFIDGVIKSFQEAVDTKDISTNDTNANTECSGTYSYLSGEGVCRDVRTDGDIYDNPDTNANTECSGTYSYLSGEGVCRDVRTDGDIYDNPDTRCDASGTCSRLCIGSSCKTSWFSCGSVSYFKTRYVFDYNGGTSGCSRGNWNCLTNFCKNIGYSGRGYSGYWINGNWFHSFDCWKWEVRTVCIT